MAQMNAMPAVTFKSTPFGKTVVWRITNEDKHTNRWSADVKLARMKISVEVLVPIARSKASQLTVVDRAIRNLSKRFDPNINKILQWYKAQYPDREPKRFRRELLKSATLFMDFTVTPVKRELIFWKTHLQHLGVPVSSHGNVP